MSLVFSCIAAHTPLLMPTIGKEGLAVIEKTKSAMQQLEQELYVAQPETIIVISPHGDSLPDALSINLNSKYVTNFEEFGDLVTKLEWKSEIMLIDRIREDFKEKHLPLVLGSSEFVDYGSAIPLYYLTQHLPTIRVVPLITSQLDMKTHYTFGKELKDEIMSSTKRIAVIASADLSHRVSENSPEGLSPKGVAFDEKIVDVITKQHPMGILDIDEPWIAEAQACGGKVLATVCGLMDDVKHEAKVLSYEKPFGVGYLVARMKIG
ncbi:MAG TPA: AmmeMemoRadiSam system protein B [Candidatus Eisenbacteria bacterium]|jgi:AmmeMemoRadiSam system protein B|nr:AmmeMemoRadiSam system protein B [Candidatus Eisenbacteria bacterium]